MPDVCSVPVVALLRLFYIFSVTGNLSVSLPAWIKANFVCQVWLKIWNEWNCSDERKEKRPVCSKFKPPLSLLCTLSHQWFEKPDYNLFSPYMVYRRRHPEQPFYILHPSYVWQLWDVIQGNTQEDIQPNPPSSGFIGRYTHAPSVRLSLLCSWRTHAKTPPSTHGHMPRHDENVICRMRSDIIGTQGGNGT